MYKDYVEIIDIKSILNFFKYNSIFNKVLDAQNF